MTVALTAFAPVPGGPELLVLLLIFLLLIGLPLLVLAALAWIVTRRRTTDGKRPPGDGRDQRPVNEEDRRGTGGERPRAGTGDEAVRNRLEELERRVERLEDEKRDGQ